MATKRGRLFLTRRLNEVIVIRHPDGTETFVRVASLGGSRVSLLVEAPESVAVWKLETDPKRNGARDTAVVPQAAIRQTYIDAESAVAGMFGEPDGEGSEM